MSQKNPATPTAVKITGILFDKDGTLIDFNRTWLPRIIQAAEYLANDTGQPDRSTELLVAGGYLPDTSGWQPDSLLSSGTNRQIYQFWGELLGVVIEGERFDKCQEFFSLSGHEYAVVLDDMDGYMKSLNQKGIRIGVATMDDELNARATLDKIGCSSRVDFVCGADSGFGVKPEPGMVTAFCEQCDLLPDNVMMVGDSPRDLKMGRNAGVALTIGVLTGATEAEHLLPFADHVFDDISGLISLLP